MRHFLHTSRAIFLSITTAFALVACGGGGGSGDSGGGAVVNQVAGNVTSGVKVTDTSGIAATGIAADGTGLTVASNNAVLSQAKDGDVVVLAADANNGLPLGYAGLVAKQADGSVKLNPAQLGDVFRSLQVDFDSSRDGGLVAGVMAHSNAKADITMGYPKTLQGGLDYVTCRVQAALSVNGGIACKDGKLSGTITLNHPVMVKKKGSSDKAPANLYAEISLRDLVQKVEIDFDPVKYPQTGGVNKLSSRITGAWDFSMGVKLNDDQTKVEIPSWSELIRSDASNIWDDNTKIKFGKYFELSGLNGDDKKGLIPLGGFYLTPATVAAGGVPFSGELSAAQLGQIKGLGTIIWIYVDLSGNITLSGELDMVKVTGASVDKGFRITNVNNTLQTEIINNKTPPNVLAPYVKGGVEVTKNVGFPLVADVLVAGIRPATVKVDVLAFNVTGKIEGAGGYQWSPAPQGVTGYLCEADTKKLYSKLDFRAAVKAKLDMGWLEASGGLEKNMPLEYSWWEKSSGACVNNFDLPLTYVQTTANPSSSSLSNVEISFKQAFDNAQLRGQTGRWQIFQEGPLETKFYDADTAYGGNITVPLAQGDYKFTVVALHKDINGSDGKPLVVASSKPLAVSVSTPTINTTIATPTIGQTIQLWLSNAWSDIKKVIWSFSDSVTTFAANVANGVSEKVNQTFNAAGTKTITATYKDANGNTLGSGNVSLTVTVGSITQTTSITSVKDDSGATVVNVSNGGSTTDTTPLIAGTVSEALGSFYTVRVYDGSSLLGTAALSGTTWSFTSPALSSGTHSLKAVVARGDGVEGTASAAWAITINSNTVSASKLPDTGITANQCYAAGSNTLVSCTSAAATALSPTQDGMVGRDVANNDNSDGKAGFSYSLVPKTGGGTYDKTECVKDNITGLTWEGKPASGTRGSPALNPNGGYTNYQTGYTDGNGNAVTPAQVNATTNAQGYVNAVNAAGLCGYSDWRLPTAKELQTIVDYGVAYPGPTIDGTWFPNTQGSVYWSSSPYVGDSNYAWFVYFYYGVVVSYYSRGSGYYVRLVR